MTGLAEQVSEQGFALLSGIFEPSEVELLRQQSTVVFEGSSTAIRQRSGSVYAARNVLSLWPETRSLGQHPRLQPILELLLGTQAGLVRGLFFDKPPEQTWSLPWHQDKLIAVRPDSLDTSLYSPARLRMGVPHSEPPAVVLESMLTVRIHLDDMTPENGPLEVLPGSHRHGKTLHMQPFTPQTLHCRAGDILLMRPLLGHASGKSRPGCGQHRRILHLEFAASPKLPGGAEWWQFYPVVSSPDSL